MSELPQDLPDWLVDQIEERAANERQGGGEIEIDWDIPTVAITMSNGDEYFYQEADANDLLRDIPDNVSPEDWLLAQFQNA